MKPADLITRCYAVKHDELWSAFCIDLSLAAQAGSFDEARQKLEAQICEYVDEALSVDREHAAQLLSRKAPLCQRAMWHWLRLRHRLHTLKQAGARLFTAPLPLVSAIERRL
jgi:hypothetical protein